MKKDNKKGLLNVTVMLAVITLVTWVLLLVIQILTVGVEFSDLIDNIMGNLLGILPPIIIFNFIYEYLTKETIAKEMSETITSTLMSNPEAIDNFSMETKKNFIETTIGTIVGEESKESVYNVVAPYLNNEYNIKKYFKYNITLRDYTKVGSIFKNDNYISVQESLVYRKRFSKNRSLNNVFRLGYFLSEAKLDQELRTENYIFRENLVIGKSELDQLMEYTRDEKINFILNEMNIKVLVDNEIAQLRDVIIDENGIDILYQSNHVVSDEYKIDISFSMPQLKGYSEFMVSINEPTFSPLIQFFYPENTMRVKMFSFINEGDTAVTANAMRTSGICDISLEGKWIYPMSGVIFVVENICE